ncbi:MAG: carbon-nitrogen hydrolase family protein [Alphaproteobacteria bacterium]|nr:carbon-nitrogen hydrolase family protein [Alphaproteobacteria bacterium]
MAVKQLKVAAVQMECRPGDVEENLAHAAQFVKVAVQRGAQLVLLPELMPGGYQLTEELWDSAEPSTGRSVTFLKSLARQYNVYLGTSFLEADGEDFFNSFVLIAPDGKIAGRVRKSPPASVEAYFYRAGDDSHVIETEIGRIGVSICYETLLYERLFELYRASVDIVLLPSAAGRPMSFIPGDIERFDRMVRLGAPHYAKALGVPVVMANRTGPLQTKLPGVLPELKSSFPGLSMIVDSDGVVKAALGDEEDVIVADVHLEPNRKVKVLPSRIGRRWAVPVPWYAFVWPLTQRMGERAYAKDAHRKERAEAASRDEVPNPP